jgi:hypothetical protein
MQRVYVDEHGDEQVEDVRHCDRCNAEVVDHDKSEGPAECEDCKEDFRELRETIIKQATEIAQLHMLVDRIKHARSLVRDKVRRLEEKNDKLSLDTSSESPEAYWDYIIRQLMRVDEDLANKVRRYRP